jgi:hypothetical protein
VSRVSVTLTSGSVTVCAVAVPQAADESSAANAAAPLRLVLSLVV